MLYFWVYENQRIPCDIPGHVTVLQAKKIVSSKLGFRLAFREENKVLVLRFAGSELEDSWILGDLNIVPGSTLKLALRARVQPSLFVFCRYNRETFSIDNINWIGEMMVSELRQRVSEHTGLPVSVSRLLSPDGREMYDMYRLSSYGIAKGMKIFMETWDGWNEFLMSSIAGSAKAVIASTDANEIVARFQWRVALYIAAHFGHVDLASYIMKLGVKSHEPVGEHPARQWCNQIANVNSQKAPVHEAAQQGQYVLLRLFVSQDICCLLAKDGSGQNPLSISLRRKMKECASFLLAKQWTKVQVTKELNLPVILYSKMLIWADRAKHRALVSHGLEKSSLKHGNKNRSPLVTFGVLVDGFSPSQINSRPLPLHSEPAWESSFLNLASRESSTLQPSLCKSLTHMSNTEKIQRRSITPTSAKKTSLPPLQLSKTSSQKDSPRSMDTCMRTSSSLQLHGEKTDPRQIVTKETGRRRSQKIPKIEISKMSLERSSEGSETNSKFSPFLPMLENSGDERSNKDSYESPSYLKCVSDDKSGWTTSSDSPSLSSDISSRKFTGRRNFSRARKCRPFFYYPGSGDSIVRDTLASYEKYCEQTPSQRAKRALAIAETFKEKSFLLRLKIAMGLYSGPIKRLPRLNSMSIFSTGVSNNYSEANNAKQTQ